MKFTDAFCGKLDEIQCSYERETDNDGQEMVSFGVAGENFNGLRFFVLFDNDASAQIMCHVCKFSSDKNLPIRQVVNQLNIKYRWTKFSASSSGIVGVTVDVEATENTASDVIFHNLCRMNTIVDKAYPVLMKVIYS